MRRDSIPNQEDDAKQYDQRVAIWVCVWLLLSVLASASGVFTHLPVLLSQIIMFVVITILLWLFFTSENLSIWLTYLPVRVLVAVHIVRFLSIYYFLLYSFNQMPYPFAVLTAWADIFVAWGAIILLFWRTSLNIQAFWKMLLIWNSIGLGVQIMSNAIFILLELQSPGSMNSFKILPLSLFPIFIFPLLSFSHIMIFVRFFRTGEQG